MAREGVDLYMSYWGSPMIAHTIASWDFGDDAPPLAISIETRKEVGEAYSAVLGFFHQFELYYVVADDDTFIQLGHLEADLRTLPADEYTMWGLVMW